MLNRSDAFKLAFNIKEKELVGKRLKYSSAIEALENKNPEFKEINTKLGALGAQTAITALSGDLARLSELKMQIGALNDQKQKMLEAAGINPPLPQCEKCGDTGYVDGKICDCIKTLAKLLMLDELSKSLPLECSRFENFSLEYYSSAEENGSSPKKRMTKIFKLCKEYTVTFAPSTAENLLFMGSSGLGKTHLSLAIVYELLNKGYDVVYGSAYNLFSAMENEHFNLRSDASYNAAVECDLLVIDDLGGEFVSPYIQTLLYNIINTRLLASRPTVISTNLTMAEIENRYTPRVSSRLLGNYNAKKFLGNDIRQIKVMNKA